MQFDFALELLISAKMLVALVLGAVIGIDREHHGNSPRKEIVLIT